MTEQDLPGSVTEPELPGPLRAAVAAVALGWRASPGALLCRLGVTVVAAAAAPAAAWFSKLLVDELSAGPEGELRLVVVYAVAGAVLAATMLLADHALGYVIARHSAAITLVAESELFRRICGFVGLRHLENPTFQDRLLMAEHSAADGPSALTGSAQSLARSVISLVGFLAVIAAVWPLMAVLLVLAAVPGLVAEIGLARRHVTASLIMSTHDRRRLFYRWLLTDYRAAKEVRLFGLGPLFRQRQVQALRRSQEVMVSLAGRTAAIQSGLGLLGVLLAGVGVAVVAGQVLRGELSTGDVVLFLAAVGGVQGALSTMVGEVGNASQAIRMYRHYLAVMAAPPDLPAGDRPAPALRAGLRLEDVWFRYDPSGPWVLRGVDLELPVGTSLGLVGVNGAGKSTLVKLICRCYDPDRGRILWDGVDLRELDPESLRSRLAATFQDFMTYDLSVGENIGVGDVAHLGDVERVRRSAQRAGIDEAVSRFPRGYDTMLSRMYLDESGVDEHAEAGVDLSGGQWQRIALARSLMREDADLLILDEPSSGLDPAAEDELHHTLRGHRDGRTAILISHRLGAIRLADRIVVLDDGVIAEQGTHDELMAVGGTYARLFTLQARGYHTDPAGVPA